MLDISKNTSLTRLECYEWKKRSNWPPNSSL